MGLSLSILGPRRSPSSDITAATLQDGDCEAEKQSGGDGYTGSLAQDVSSDSDSYSDLDTDEEDMVELGDGIWLHEEYLAHLRKPKDMDIILFCRGSRHGHPGMWMAVAPE